MLYFSIYPIISCYCRTSCCRQLHLLLRLFCTPVLSLSQYPALCSAFQPLCHTGYGKIKIHLFSQGRVQIRDTRKLREQSKDTDCTVCATVLCPWQYLLQVSRAILQKRQKKLRWDNVNMRFFTSSCNDFPLDWEFFRMRMSSENRDKAPKPRNTSV